MWLADDAAASTRGLAGGEPASLSATAINLWPAEVVSFRQEMVDELARVGKAGGPLGCASSPPRSQYLGSFRPPRRKERSLLKGGD